MVPLYLRAVHLLVQPPLVVSLELVSQLHLLQHDRDAVRLEMLEMLYMDADLAQHRVDAVVHGLEVSELPRHTARLRPAPRPRPRAAAGQPVVPPVIEPDSLKLSIHCCSSDI